MLIKCRECGRDISSLSKNCIHCGWPLPDSIMADEPTHQSFSALSYGAGKPRVSSSARIPMRIEVGDTVTLNEQCLKIDHANAFGMISGFITTGLIRHTSIWIDVVRKKTPALLTLNRSPSKFQMSNKIFSRGIMDFTMPYKYIAVLHKEYFIKNERALWETICNNGIFDIWSPGAPYSRLQASTKDPKYFRIALLRLYEIDRIFDLREIHPATTRIDKLIPPDLRVKIERPVVDDGEFKAIQDLLEASIEPYLQ